MSDLRQASAPPDPPPGALATEALNNKPPDAAAGMRSSMAAEQKELAGPSAELDKVLNSPRPARPTPEKVPEPPKRGEDFQKASQGFMTTSILLAGLASVFNRAHITTALNAFGASMKGFHAGQLEAGETAYKEWKQSSDTVIANNNAMLDEYKAVMADRALSITELNGKIARIASTYKDKFMYESALMNNTAMTAQLLEQHDAHTKQYAQHAAEMETAHNDRMAALKASTENKFPGLATPAGIQQMAEKLVDATPEKRDAMMQILNITHPQMQVAVQKAEDRKAQIEAGKINDETLDTMADQYLAGDRSVLQNIGRGVQGSANIKALRERVEQRAKARGMSGSDIALATAEFGGLQAGERTLGTRTANVEMAVTEAQKLVPIALQASERVDRTKYPSLNTILIAAERGTGDPEVVRLGVAFNSVINVYARAISPTGVPTVNDKEHAREILAANWSKGQVKAGLDQIMIELDAARQSPGAVKQEFHERYGSKPAVPEPGTVQEGYKFKGGDPGNSANWEKVQ